LCCCCVGVGVAIRFDFLLIMFLSFPGSWFSRKVVEMPVLFPLDFLSFLKADDWYLLYLVLLIPQPAKQLVTPYLWNFDMFRSLGIDFCRF
jgi:hypothetical protein